ncbi:MAG TPA: hypothetical protein VLX59_05855 [Acidimicrobiales bacterium]|nr:hypothetical protein [Acidimicrobiales bacterium]
MPRFETPQGLPVAEPVTVLAPWRPAGVVSAIVGVAMLSLLALVVPHSVLSSLATAFLLLGVAYQPTHPVFAGGATAMGAIPLVGARPGRSPPGPNTG